MWGKPFRIGAGDSMYCRRPSAGLALVHAFAWILTVASVAISLALLESKGFSKSPRFSLMIPSTIVSLIPSISGRAPLFGPKNQFTIALACARSAGVQRWHCLSMPTMLPSSAMLKALRLLTIEIIQAPIMRMFLAGLPKTQGFIKTNVR
jgi:hypothetical protein